MPLNIGILVFPGHQLLDATGPAATFDVATRVASSGRGYAVTVHSMRGGGIPSSAGVILQTTVLTRTTRLDTLVVVGGQGTKAAATDAALLEVVRGQASRCRRVASVCTGAFVLAAAGLLRRRRATTHWREAGRLAALFPDVTVEPDRIFVRDGKLWTSAGVTAGIDLALAMVAEDLGEEVARATAQELVVYYRRPGGQSQFSSLLDLSPAEGRFTSLPGFVREHLDEQLSIDRLAAKAGMSPRNFARVFVSEVGVTPSKAVERIRLESAREQIETTTCSIDEIARACGFAAAERMRRSFIRRFGQPPQALRRISRGA
jgi:transcriptional regulator GlxA family with amidase domain